MRMQPAHFRIGELAQKIGVERFVIRFWEKEFQIKSHRSDGGQRFFTHKEFETFKTIKHLLYEQKFTIEGAKKILKDNKKLIIGSYRTTLSAHATNDELYLKLKKLQSQLIKLREVL
ncbi:TPA: MerR family transcriptional regulator [Candidatus Dependentiae bacterium]|nr:MAG: Transcriptional regulator, MerR family [candidate division TM6 bacterium GW2011_GWF2_36_131]KKQ02813.1 MAG: Transcriptional regulator, MerR family [candidate division TM6 bacterium GW2011_GWE2_36_25]KKQ18979.1 MAG: Transcriptional regulator, MerR family [candidate division TM6 bacterium GW2011_GWA2_36_9]HBR70992.1 MerR family transcriptional regulator [Candidatus Dependentiae bacterium]HCU00245.1 MerR family transcriptional regulator [Candidatus Dependentiae bacterium]